MKILHLVPTLSAGGAETFVTHLAVAQRDQGHDVDVFLLAGAFGERGQFLRSRLETATVNCFGTTPRSARAPLNVVRLLNRIVKGRYDVIHAHLFSVELVLASLIPILYAARLRPLLVRTLHSSNIYGSRSRFLTWLLAHCFDWNFACGRKVEENYADLFGRSRVSVIQNGVATPFETFDQSCPSVRQDLNLPPDAFLVVCVGAFRGVSLATSAKAQDVALRAFQLAFESQPSAHLLFAGDGELRSEAEALAHELGATRNVHFLGNFSNIEPLLRDADLLFLPSRYEGLPMVGLEAGCAGVPVLASSILELLDVGSPLGWYFPKDNSVEEFARQLTALRQDKAVMGRRAKQKSEQFRERYGIDRCAREYVTAIQGLLENRRRSAWPTSQRKVKTRMLKRD